MFDTSNMIFYIFIIDLQLKSSSNRIRNHVIQSSWINNSNEQILCRIETRTNPLIFVMLSNTHYRPKPLQMNFHVHHPRYAWILTSFTSYNCPSSRLSGKLYDHDWKYTILWEVHERLQKLYDHFLESLWSYNNLIFKEKL